MTDRAGVRDGGCLCGAVRYRVRGPLRAVVACHCTQCRRSTGHFMAATAARRADFELLQDSSLKWFDSSGEARRGFCGVCGSTLFWEGRGRDYLSIAAGTLDDSAGLTTAVHIFVADKGAYYQIEPGVPQLKDGRFSVPLPAS
jgi:hypothetical protein